MKKQLLALTLAAATAAGANAQAVLGYSVTKTQGSYTPLTNPTVVFDAPNVNTVITDNLMSTVWSPQGLVQAPSAQGYDLGFTANVAGTPCTNFLISGAGCIYLGNGEVNLSNVNRGNFMNLDGNYTVVGAGNQRDSKGTPATKISYQVSGQGSDAVLTVQYENIGQMYAFFGEPATIDMQVSLAADGTVSVVYNNLANVGDGNKLFMLMGARQGTDYVCAVEGTDGPAVMRNNFNTYPVLSTDPDGTTFTFTPPAAVTAPATSPADLTVSATSTKLSGSYSAVSDADTYLVLYTRSDAADFTPANGTIYTAGQQVADGVTVAYFGPNTSFEVNNLPSSTSFGVNVYAANSYGIGGPAYSTAKTQVAASTLPAAPQAVNIGQSGLDFITLNVTPNATDDDVVVLYTDFCQRDNYGDHGLFGALTPETAQGDVLAVPADYTPMFVYTGAPQPADGGKVAYVGKGGADIKIQGLNPSTGYFLAVYSRDANGKYSSDVVYSGSSTYITAPTEGNSDNYPRYSLPFGWTTSENGNNTFSFQNQSYLMRGQISQGSQVIQQTVKMNRGDAVNGNEGWMTLAPVTVAAPHTQINVHYCLNELVSRFATNPYAWYDGDQLAIRVSTDNGETWTVAAENNKDSHTTVSDKLAYTDLAADLTPYTGKTVLVQLYLKTYTPSQGLNLYVDRISLKQLEDTAAPSAVTVGQLTATTAVVSWTGSQTDYTVRYVKVGTTDDFTTQLVEGAATCTLTGLEAQTTYLLSVQGHLSSGTTDWSEPVTFTTPDYAPLEAPEGLEANVSNEVGTTAVMSWQPVEGALYYELNFRPSTSTTWTIVQTADLAVTRTDLQPATTYICKVRALGANNRKSAYSAQVRFTTGETTGIESVSIDAADNATYYDLTGRPVANPATGIYLRHANGKVSKVYVK